MKLCSINPLCLAVLMTSLWTASGTVKAQAPGVPIESPVPLGNQTRLVAKAKALHESGKLVGRERWEKLLKHPEPSPVLLMDNGSQKLDPREIYQRARKATVRVGWFYLCTRCDHWHLNLAGGYAISADGVVATCNHCIEPDPSMREAYMVAVDCEGNVLPVKSVLARSQAMDTAIVRVEGGAFTPVALDDQVSPGDAAYLWSDPLEVSGYFSIGAVNRFFWAKEKGSDASTLQGVKQLRMNVSTDWAPGSSGAAVFNQKGNVIGHVESISPMSETVPTRQRGAEKKVAKPEKEEDRFNGAPLITLHQAIPARGVLSLAGSMGAPSPQKQAADEHLDALADLLDTGDESEVPDNLKQFDKRAADFRKEFASDPDRWRLAVLEVTADELREALNLPGKLKDADAHLRSVLAAEDAPLSAKAAADNKLLIREAGRLIEETKPDAAAWEKKVATHFKQYPDDPDAGQLRLSQLQLVIEVDPKRAEALANALLKDEDEDVAEAAKSYITTCEQRRKLASEPFDLKFTALDGRRVDLAKWRGKVVLLDFWATWCGPCMEALPSVRKAFEKYKGKGLEIAGISLDESEGPLEAAIKRQRISWPQRYTGNSWDDALVKKLNITEIPALWLVNKKGYIVEFNAERDLEAKIEKLLAE